MVKLARARRAFDSARGFKPGQKKRSPSQLPLGIQQSIYAIAHPEDLPEPPEPELVQAIERRIPLLERAKTDLEFRGEEYQKCKRDVEYFVSNWCWTYDPRRSPPTIPFDLFPKQAEYLDWLQGRIAGKEVGLVEKSRDAGLTWLCVAFAAHQFLFVTGSKTAFGSRKEMLVDRLGDPDSIFEKIRMLLDNLPTWLTPKNYSDGCLKFVNSDNGATITGEAGDNIGRGGRSRIYFVDEAAYIERPKRVDAALSQNTNVRIYVSTPNGENEFSHKRHSGKFPVFTFHWRDDPRKDEAWYQKQKDTLDLIILAQEVDIDYHASRDRVVIPGPWVRAAVELELAPVGDRVAGLDVADGGANRNVLILRRGPVVFHVEDWDFGNGNTTQTAFKARDVLVYHRINRLNYDCIGVGSNVGGTLRNDDHTHFTIQPINGGASTTDTFYSGFNREAKDAFANLRAELWWLLRNRFYKTYEHVNRIKKHPVGELISIPNHPTLITQLSQPEWKFTNSGQILVESKEAMIKRGVQSPDFADALVYAIAPLIDVDDFGWLANA